MNRRPLILGAINRTGLAGFVGLGGLGLGALGLAVGLFTLWSAAPQADAQQPPAQQRPATQQTIPRPGAGRTPAADPTADAYRQQLSYALGLDIGESLRSDRVPLDLSSYAAGVRDGLEGAQPKMTQEQRVAVLTRFQQEMMQRAQRTALENKQAGAAFLAKNLQEPGWKTTESGLQYKILKQGSGATPAATDKVRAHYEGRLIDGTVFDSSYERGEPTEFPVGGVIAGWTEALQMMKVGGKWELAIPSDIAYGIEGRAPKIGPNQTLLFTIELVDVLP